MVFPVNAIAFHPGHGTFASGGGLPDSDASAQLLNRPLSALLVLPLLHPCCPAVNLHSCSVPLPSLIDQP